MIVNMYPSIAKSPDFLTASDGTDMTLTMLRLFCNDISGMAPQIGDSWKREPSDPLFWPTHPTLDRMWHWRMINGMDDMTGPTRRAGATTRGRDRVACRLRGRLDREALHQRRVVLFDPTNSSVPPCTTTRVAALRRGGLPVRPHRDRRHGRRVLGRDRHGDVGRPARRRPGPRAERARPVHRPRPDAARRRSRRRRRRPRPPTRRPTRRKRLPRPRRAAMAADAAAAPSTRRAPSPRAQDPR